MSRGAREAIILAGGKGTRLRSVVADRPKALAQVAGRPFLDWLLLALRAEGIEHVILCTGFGSKQIEAHVKDGRQFGLDASYVRDPVPLGTGGAVRQGLERASAEHVFVLNGDSYCPLRFQELEKQHILRGAKATLRLVRVEEASRFGASTTDEQGAILAFAEKSTSGPGLINAGVYLLRRDVRSTLVSAGELSLERQVFPRWIGKGLYAVQGEGPFIDIGTKDSYAHAERAVDWKALAQAAKETR